MTRDTWRDVQRDRVYRAQRKVDPHRHDRELFPDLDAVRTYVLGACSRKRVQAAFPRAILVAEGKLYLKDGGGTRSARGGWYGPQTGAMLSLPLWSRNRLVILHELAHGLVPNPKQSHGWEFCQGLLRLVLLVEGREAHDRLKAAFKAERVRFRKPPARRELSPEQKAAAIERLRTYRESKAAATKGGE